MTTKAESYATHVVKIWADNDEGMYTHLQQFTHDEDLLVEEIKKYIEDLKDNSGINGLLVDLINASIDEVDFREVARHFID